MKLAEQIKEIMKEKGLEPTAPVLYRAMLDVGFRGTQNTVRGWIDRGAKPMFDHVPYLTQAVGVSADIFFGGQAHE